MSDNSIYALLQDTSANSPGIRAYHASAMRAAIDRSVARSSTRQCAILLPANPHFARMRQEIIAPAIIAAGMTPLFIEEGYPPASQETLADRIRSADVVLTDLSRNTSEAWFAIGCALSLNRPLCLLSSTQLPPSTLALLRAHLISYSTDTFSEDHVQLQGKISSLLRTCVPAAESILPASRKPVQSETRIQTQVESPLESQLESQLESKPESQAQSQPAAPRAVSTDEPRRPDITSFRLAVNDELTSYEILALTIIHLKSTEHGISPRQLGIEMQSRNAAHLTSRALASLKRRRFIERRSIQMREGDLRFSVDNVFLAPTGESWLVEQRTNSTMPVQSTQIH